MTEDLAATEKRASVERIKAANEAVLKANDVICNNISALHDQPGLLSQNILLACRTLTEDLALRYYAEKNTNDNQSSQGRWEDIKAALALIHSPATGITRKRFKILREFHDLLQITSSHYVQDTDTSERLMVKYLDYLFQLRDLARDDFGLNILGNLEMFPLAQDQDEHIYYETAAGEIERLATLNEPLPSTRQRFYILRKKPFFVRGRRYFEIHYTPSSGRSTKNERRTAFTAIDIPDFHALKLGLRKGEVNVFGHNYGIDVICDFKVSIMPSELGEFCKLMTGRNQTVSEKVQAYISLMQRLTVSRESLRDLVVETSEQEFAQFLTETGLDNLADLRNAFIIARKLILSQGKGARIVSYLLLRLRLNILKAQENNLFDKTKKSYSFESNDSLSGLFLAYGCIPFDTMPLCTSLQGHNPPLEDLAYSIDFTGREHELLIRALKNRSAQNRQIFNNIKEVCSEQNISETYFGALAHKYNQSLYSKHLDERELKEFSGFVYFNGAARACRTIFRKLSEFSKEGVDGWRLTAEQSLNKLRPDVSAEKIDALKNLFGDTKVKLVYGAAGTGKTRLMEIAAELLSNSTKVFLAVTHTAVDNLQRRIAVPNSTFMTVEKALSRKTKPTDLVCSVLFIDECGCLCNRDMEELLKKCQTGSLVLVGDEFQVEPIEFGNWFAIARGFLPKHAHCELSANFRSSDAGLLKVWERVRTQDPAAIASIETQGMSGKLDNSLFTPLSNDEIVLCLGYDGIYGINSINRYQQETNPNHEFRIGVAAYKVNDPVVFNDSTRFAPYLYNNLKGVITDITPQKDSLLIEIETKTPLMSSPVYPGGLKVKFLTDAKGNPVTRVSFEVAEPANDEQEQSDPRCDVPFQVAYAISVHKAQGLEYESVKLIVSDRLAPCVTLNLLYTAITRSKRYLKIYWSKQAEQQVLNNLAGRNFGRDVSLLRNLFPELSSI